jgi:hypothetical protein
MREPVYILIPDERALSWNDIYESRHWAHRYRLSKRKHGLVRGYLDPDDGPIDELVDVYVLATFTSDPLDSDNVCAKAYLDGLKPVLLHDDNIKFVRHVTTRAKLGSENCVEIWLTPVRNDDGN